MEAADEYLQVGVIASIHGLKGEVKVFPTTDDPKRFSKLKAVYIDYNGQLNKTAISSVKYFKNMVIVKFAGLDSIEAVTPLRNRPLMVERTQAVKLSKDEYFIADLIGMKAYDLAGMMLGTITEVYSTGANDVYEITRELPLGDQEKTILIPAIKDCIKEVDTINRRMTVQLLNGMG